MATKLLSLPNEMLQEILVRLPKADLKSARLSCKCLADIGVHHLLTRVFFAPRKRVMQNFENIAAHPILSKLVTEMVYDTRLFVPWMFHDGDHSSCTHLGCVRYSTKQEACGWGMLEGEDRGTAAELARRYQSLLAAQQTILADHEDRKVLLAGLRSMPRLSALFITHDFEINGVALLNTKTTRRVRS